MGDVKFYVYLGNEELGSERLGSFGRMVIHDIKTARGAIRRCNKYWSGKEFRVYSFANFYDESTFRRVY